jgi:hypothetical protein
MSETSTMPAFDTLSNLPEVAPEAPLEAAGEVAEPSLEASSEVSQRDCTGVRCL